MRVERAFMKNKKCLVSVLFVCVLVATNMFVIFPLTAPKAKAIVHDISTSAEDGNPMYDMDGMVNQVVIWDEFDDHIISDPAGYTVNPGYTLDIPNLDYSQGLPAENVIEFQAPGQRIDVYGTLITNAVSHSPSSARMDGLHWWRCRGLGRDIFP